MNDGSKDGTLSVLKKIAKEDARVVIVDQENKGVSAARNAALKQATGKYLTMVDADDDLPENALKSMLDLMQEGVDLVVGSHMQVRIGKKAYLEPNMGILQSRDKR